MILSPLLQAIPISEQGIPLPYLPGRDDTIALLLLCCFLLSSYILSRSRKFLLQLGKDFIMHRERASIFAISSGTDIRFLLVLILQTCANRYVSKRLSYIADHDHTIGALIVEIEDDKYFHFRHVQADEEGAEGSRRLT